MIYNDKANKHFDTAKATLEATTRGLNRLILHKDRNTVADIDAISRFVHDLAQKMQSLEHVNDVSKIEQGLVETSEEINDLLCALHAVHAAHGG